MAVQLTEPWNQLAWDGIAELVAGGAPEIGAKLASRSAQPRQRQHRLHPEQVASLVADYQAGESIQGLGRKYQVRDETARRWLVVNGVEIRSVAPGFPVKRTAEAVALRNAGWSWHRLGQRFGCSHTSARRAVLKAQAAGSSLS